MIDTTLKQFIVYKLVPSVSRPGKIDKIPVDSSGHAANPHDPANQFDQAAATSVAARLEPKHGVGFVFTADDPYFFVDIDNCLTGSTWSDVALDILAMFPGAFVEVSQSGAGLHVIGRGPPIEHGCDNAPFDMQFYTEKRFVALTGLSARGSIDQDCSDALPLLVAKYFPPLDRRALHGDGPVEGYGGPSDDDDLVVRALQSKSAASLFGDAASFEDLWTANMDKLSVAYPDEGRPCNASNADAGLAQHLAFWTGNDAERIERLMRRSDLVRSKWDREDYLPRTIARACSLQTTWYRTGPEDNGPPLNASSVAQREAGQRARARRLEAATPEQREVLNAAAGPAADARFWLNGTGASLEQLTEQARPIAASAGPHREPVPKLVSGFQYLSGDMQMEHFKGCVYVQHSNRILAPSGAMLKPEQFNATYGGYVFQLDESGNKTTRKAWEAFTESQLVRWPKADDTTFAPDSPLGTLTRKEGRVLVNTYTPLPIETVEGDVTPFLSHLAKLLPDAGDRAILLAYLAACLQHKGVKFQWAPLLQGVEGNGKSLFTRCLAYAVGERYTHLPLAGEIAEKYNAWLFGKIFIGVEDIYVEEHRAETIETLKPMITNPRHPCRDMGAVQVTRDNLANFLFNANHPDAVRKTRNDRRFCIFLTAQQQREDKVRDGMTDRYFSELYAWLRGGGYARVAWYLEHYDIPDELNPASGQVAPETSTTQEALEAATGGVEQEVQEAVEEGRVGFKGGWISSMALDRLLGELRMKRAISHCRRRELLKEMGYEWHPALPKGRADRVVSLDGGKPKLFVGKDCPDRSLTAGIVEAYEKAQNLIDGTVNNGRVLG